ncbi:ubiquitin domain at the C-terminus [Cryptosporidium bovis]|uniref:ubiquitin domain at the C-terminus n=1 Tax=Cryptosporidium bovis TaxID=310047 RepID=UPI00351A4334|nr:ubiquitin domain at the C-terminus [Cryptosporidium bovis]
MSLRNKSDFEDWESFVDQNVTLEGIKSGYFCMKVPDCLKLSRITPEDSLNSKHSVMYSPFDIRELTIYCGEKEEMYVSGILWVLFKKLLSVVGVFEYVMMENNKACLSDVKKRRVGKTTKEKGNDDNVNDYSRSNNDNDNINVGNIKRDLFETLVGENGENDFYPTFDWCKCNAVTASSHSLPLSTPLNWLSCSDIEHVVHDGIDTFYLHDLFYVCLPLKLKHSCIHEDKEKVGINPNPHKELIIILTEKFGEFCNHLIRFKGLETAKSGVLELVDYEKWDNFYPTKSLRLGLFMSMKISSLHLYKYNSRIFPTPFFLRNVLHGGSITGGKTCCSCYYSWIRLVGNDELKNENSGLSSVLSEDEMKIMALEAKSRIFLSGLYSKNLKHFDMQRVVSNISNNDGRMNALEIKNLSMQSIGYIGKINWPGRTSKGVLNPEFLVGIAKQGHIVIGVNKIEEMEICNELESKEAENWSQGGEILFPPKENSMCLFEDNIEKYYMHKFKLNNHRSYGICSGMYGSDFNNSNNTDECKIKCDITNGNTIFIKLCSKYTTVPYFSSKNILKMDDTQIYGNSALGISKNRQNPDRDISIHLLSKISSYLTLREFCVFRSVCKTHCCRTIFNNYVQNLCLFEDDLCLATLGQLYPFLSKGRVINLTNIIDPDQGEKGCGLGESSFIDPTLLPVITYYSSKITPISIQCLSAYTQKAKKMIFTHHSSANLAKIVSRASGRKPETVVITPDFNFSSQNDDYNDDYLFNVVGIDGSFPSNQALAEAAENIINQRNINMMRDNVNFNYNAGFGFMPQNSIFDGGFSNHLPDNTNRIREDVEENEDELEDNEEEEEDNNDDGEENDLQQNDRSLDSQISANLIDADISPIPNLIEIHIIGNFGPNNSVPSNLFRIPITSPFRKLIRYFRDVSSIKEGIVDLYVNRYGVRERLIPDLSPVDYGIVKGPVVFFASGNKTLQYSQKIWISLFLVGSKNFPYLPKLRFNASMSTPFSRLAESYSRNVNIPVSDIIIVYKGTEINFNLSPSDYNVSENDIIEVLLRTKLNSALGNNFHSNNIGRNSMTQ